MSAASELLLKAEQDLDSASRILAGGEVRKYYQAGFMIQQAVEKSLKAVVRVRGGTYRKKGHPFGPLIQNIINSGLPELPDFVISATRAAVFEMAERYELPFDTGHEELDKAYQFAKQTFEWARALAAQQTP